MDTQQASHGTNNLNTPAKKSRRGFAAMDPRRQREIASLGGRAAHLSGHAHEFTSDEARAAGKKRHAQATVAGAGGGTAGALQGATERG